MRHRRQITALLRVLAVAWMALMFSGAPSLINVAMHQHDEQCADGDGDCPGNRDPGSCPPGPLCPCAPHVVIAEQPRVLVLAPVSTVQPTVFAIDTRVPASVISDGVFHPPRQLG
jgi:hypothetical protein